MTFASSFYADQPDVLVRNEIVKRSNRVAAASDTCDHSIRQFPPNGLHLFLDLLANNLLVIPDDRWEGVWSNGGPNQVMRG